MTDQGTLCVGLGKGEADVRRTKVVEKWRVPQTTGDSVFSVHPGGNVKQDKTPLWPKKNPNPQPDRLKHGGGGGGGGRSSRGSRK